MHTANEHRNSKLMSIRMADPSCLSFVLAADGDCCPRKFKPEADDSMWWSRRDAQCRAVAAALWHAPGFAHPAASECLLLLAGDLSMLRMGRALVRHVPIPTERDLVQAWHGAARRHGGGGGDGGANGGGGQHADVSPDGVIVQNVARARKAAWAQQAASSRIAALLRQSKRVPTATSVPAPAPAPTHPRLQGSAEQVAAPGDASAPSVEQLRATFDAALFDRGGKRDATGVDINGMRTIAVLLHEDFAFELPVYETTSSPILSPNSSCPWQGQRIRIVFFLGAVRDMTTAEEGALRWVCARRGVNCVSCNVGRTAEFTSKVIQMLHGHHKCGRLLPAILELERRQCATPSCSTAGPARDTAGDSSSSSLSSSDAAARKLAPLQRWRADDAREENIVNITHAEMPHQSLQLACEPPRHLLALHLIVWLPLRSHALSSALDASSLPSARRAVHGLLRLLVCTLWRSRIGAEKSIAIAADTDAKTERDSDTIVNNTATDNAAADAAAMSCERPFAMRLTIAFEGENRGDFAGTHKHKHENDAVSPLTVDLDDKFVQRMASTHRAAPSERQLLEALLEHQREKEQQRREQPALDPIAGDAVLHHTLVRFGYAAASTSLIDLRLRSEVFSVTGSKRSGGTRAKDESEGDSEAAELDLWTEVYQHQRQESGGGKDGNAAMSTDMLFMLHSDQWPTYVDTQSSTAATDDSSVRSAARRQACRSVADKLGFGRITQVLALPTARANDTFGDSAEMGVSPALAITMIQLWYRAGRLVCIESHQRKVKFKRTLQSSSSSSLLMPGKGENEGEGKVRGMARQKVKIGETKKDKKRHKKDSATKKSKKSKKSKKRKASDVGEALEASDTAVRGAKTKRLKHKKQAKTKMVKDISGDDCNHEVGEKSKQKHKGKKHKGKKHKSKKDR